MPAKKETTKKAPKKETTKKKVKAPVIEPEVLETVTAEPVIEAGEETKLETTGESRVEKYYESIGRRKEASARVRVYTKKSADVQPSEDKAIIIVNDKPYMEYFPSAMLQDVVDSPLRKLKSINRFKATVKVNGGGIRGQADAVKFGLSRALVLFDSNFSKKLRKAGFLTRDAREKERRKYGLKKARKSPQWSKR